MKKIIDPSSSLRLEKEFSLTPKQFEGQRLLSSLATHILLYGGSRSAKTFLLCRAIALRAQKSPFSRHAIMRFRFNHVKQSIIYDTWPKMMRLCFPGVPCQMSKSDWYCQFGNGAQVWFGGLDEKERLEKILGLEFCTIFLNECSQISWEAREIMITRLAQLVYQQIEGRQPQLLPLKMYYDENPPSKGHWTYNLFIKHIDHVSKKALAHPEMFASMLMNPIDNVDNLSPEYMKLLDNMSPRMRLRFRDGLFSDVVENQLFDETKIDTWRILEQNEVPEMVRIIIAVDPSGAGEVDNSSNDEIGIVVAGLGVDGNGYLLADLSCKVGPATWGRIVTDAFDRWEANAVIGEVNYGGAMVERVIQVSRPRTPFKAVTATRGKVVRAEPVSALYDEGKIRHVGYFPKLEEELTNFTTYGYQGDLSPNRADAAIWAFTELFGKIAIKAPRRPEIIPAFGTLDYGVGY